MKIRFVLLCLCIAFMGSASEKIKSDVVSGPRMYSGPASLVLDEPTSDDVTVGLDNHHSDHYEWMNIQGFWVQVRFPDEMDVDMQDHYTETLDLLNRQLERAIGVLPESAAAQLKTRVKVFLKDDCTDGGTINYWREDGEDEGWLILHCFQYLRNVLNDAYHGGEMVHGSRIWGYPSLILINLAYGWHDLVVDGGFDNSMVEDFYDHAVDCLGNSDTTNPYSWELDEVEFFAIFTAMYYLSHWDPPRSVWGMQYKYRALIDKLWNEQEYENWEDELVSC